MERVVATCPLCREAFVEDQVAWEAASCSDVVSETDLDFDNVALADFDGGKYGDEYLSFDEGDFLCRLPSPTNEHDEGWAYGLHQASGRVGWYPPAFAARF